MNDIIKIKNWLSNPNRDFATGVALYNKYKPNTKMDKFFAENLAKKIPDESAVCILFSKMMAIKTKAKLNPNFIVRRIVEDTISKPILTKSSTPKPKPLTNKTVTPISPFAKPASSKHPDVSIPQSGESHNAIIPPVKVVDPSLLPSHLAKNYQRIQEIVPLMGGIKAKLNASKDVKESKPLIDQLLALDTEKRKLWASIDEYNGMSHEEKDKILSPHPNTEKIAELANQLKTTRDSLNRKIKDIARHKKNKRIDLAAKGEIRAEQYKQQILEIEGEIEKLNAAIA